MVVMPHVHIGSWRFEAQVNVLTGRVDDAKKTLVDRLKEFDRSMMVIADFCVGWLAYICTRCSV